MPKTLSDWIKNAEMIDEECNGDNEKGQYDELFWDKEELQAEIKKAKKIFMEKSEKIILTVTKLTKIYIECNDKRPQEIQYMIGDLLKFITDMGVIDYTLEEKRNAKNKCSNLL